MRMKGGGQLYPPLGGWALAQRRQHLVGDPAFEAPGRFLGATEGERVQAGFVDMVDLLGAAEAVDGLQFLDVIWLHMSGNCAPSPRQAKNRALAAPARLRAAHSAAIRAPSNGVSAPCAAISPPRVGARDACFMHLCHAGSVTHMRIHAAHAAHGALARFHASRVPAHRHRHSALARFRARASFFSTVLRKKQRWVDQPQCRLLAPQRGAGRANPEGNR